MQIDYAPSTSAKPALAPRSQAGIHETAAAILASFNTWAFKREQPTEPERLTGLIERRVAARAAISFTLYWGKGPRHTLAPPDISSLDYLARLGQRIAAVYPPGAHFTLILTDTHARLNGHSEQSIKSYFDAIAAAAHERSMGAVRLASIVDSAARHATAQQYHIDPDVLGDLERCAAKWFRGHGDVRTGAQRYLAMNMIERRAVETILPDSIFITFNGSRYRELFPQTLPVFYMYSLRKGTSVKPWFMDADGRAFAGAGEFGG